MMQPDLAQIVAQIVITRRLSTDKPAPVKIPVLARADARPKRILAA